MKRIVTCYHCDKRFVITNPRMLSYGKTKDWCDDCWKELQYDKATIWKAKGWLD